MEHYTASNMCVLFMSISEIIYIQVAYLVAPCSPESFNTPPIQIQPRANVGIHTPGLCLVFAYTITLDGFYTKVV